MGPAANEEKRVGLGCPVIQQRCVESQGERRGEREAFGLRRGEEALVGKARRRKPGHRAAPSRCRRLYETSWGSFPSCEWACEAEEKGGDAFPAGGHLHRSRCFDRRGRCLHRVLRDALERRLPPSAPLAPGFTGERAITIAGSIPT